MSGEIGSAFVRIKADMRGFREEVNAGVKNSLRAAGTVSGAGASTARQRAQLVALGATSNRVAAEQVAASRRVRSAREQEARTSVAAEIRERRALSEQVVAYRRVAGAARAGSETQIVANRLAADSATRLGIPLSRTEQHAARAHGSLNKLERGAVAGSGAFRGLGRNIAYSSLSFIGAYGFINVARGALDQVGNLNTEQTRSTTIFGRNGRAVREWAQQAGRGLGYSKSSALEAANAFGTLFRSADLGPKKAGRFAEDFTRLGAALSLARGETDPANAERALQTGLSGRGRGLRAYGIILDQTSIKAEAFRLGLVKSDVDTGKVSLAQRRLAEAQVALVETRAKAAAGKASPLQVARAEDGVTVAQANLKKALAGSTVELTAQDKAVAAHSLVMSQGQHFIDRYGASLKSDAGQSRRFHEGVSELKEELGKALYPSFKKAREGLINWIDSVREGGPKHKQFVHDLHEIGQGAKFIYQSLRLLARGATLASDAVGGVGNAIKIAAFLYGANKFLTLAHAIRESRLALLLLGRAGGGTAGRISRDAEMMAGGFNAPLGKIGRMRGALRALAGRKWVIGVTALVGYEFIKGEAKVLRKLFGLSADDGKHGGDTSTFLGIPGLGSGSTARDQIRGKNPYPLGTSAHAAFEAGRAGKGKRFDLPGGGTAVAEGGLTEEAYRKGRAARRKAEQADRADEKRSGRDHARDRKNAARDEGKNTADIYASSMKDELAQKRKDIQQQLAQTTADLVTARKEASREIRAAVQEAHQAERDAVLQAKSNLNSLGQSLASQVGQLIDKQAERQQQSPSGPLVARLKRLNALIHAGKGTPEVIAEAKRVENEINQQERIHGKDTEKRKERITRRLADLTDQLNTGKIGIRKFNREVTALLRREGVSYRAAGRSLGISFADGFRVALRELRAQARAIAQTPARLRRLGTGFETQIIRPLSVIREQEANISRVEREQNARIAEAAKAQRKAMIEAQKLGVHATRKAGQDVVRAIHHSTGGRKEKPKPSPKRPGQRDLTDTLLGQVVRAERSGNALERSEIALARNQRGTLIREERHQTKVLERIAHQGEQELRELREVKRELRPRKGDGGKNPRDASREANATASHNLLGS